MITALDYQDLSDFLAKHRATDKETTPTHTRIPNKELNIYGGAYIIPPEELSIFNKLYYDNIFTKNRKEYLTEKQYGNAIGIDFDFRYKYDVESRQHTKEHIVDIIDGYLELMKEHFIFNASSKFDIYIFEKPNVNRLADGSLTKDGIHMIIGCKADFTIQTMIRERMLTKIGTIWELPITNTWDSVLDEGISKGVTNWQLFGSRKPGNEAYEFVQHYTISYDESDGEFMMEEKKVVDFNMKEDFSKLSIQYVSNPEFELNPKILDEYNKRLTKIGNISVKKTNSKTKMKLLVINNNENNNDEDYISINDIKDKETLDKALLNIFKTLGPNDYEIKETHEFTQILPEKYYEAGSHLLNRQVAFALKHTDDRLFLSWIKLRSKASDFDYNDIPNKFLEWKKMHRSNSSGDAVTKRSIMYWAKKSNLNEYEKIKNQTIDYYVEKSLETCAEYDLAEILKQMFKDKYVCVSYEKKGIWYVFKNHRWVTDKGLSLRSKISKELYDLFSHKSDQIYSEILEYNDEDPRVELLKKKTAKINEVKIKLKKTLDKDKILRESAEIFYDDEFYKNMDRNKYLLCFSNGVVDFKNKIFREGYPEDYITMTTKIAYIPNTTDDIEINKTKENIYVFMNSLFPIKDLNRYMWEHLASCLIGSNKNQTFNVYHGSGSNGKSILTDLMSLTLGEYKGTVPISLVTDKRTSIGGTSDEVLKLKGKRYAVMQEPSKGVKLNEGIMKELTGGDPIQARGLYSESEIFEPQFNLVVCTNNLFDIQSNDDGTWRRIRKTDFVSKFIDEGETHTDETEYVYTKDKDLKDKLPQFAPVFASMLVQIAFETEGLVKDCETVINASKKYRNGQDHIAAFVAEMIIHTKTKTDKIGKGGIMAAFKQWYEMTQGTKPNIKGQELYDYMNKKFGNCNIRDNKWVGITFMEPTEDDDEDL